MKARILPCLAVAALAFTSVHAAPPDPGFVAHEWGTFTSVQGADGVQMSWNPLVAPELPSFVYDRSRPRKTGGLAFVVAGKTGMMSTQRLETPVIYFYSDRERTLDVSVRFPQGTVTEWYPLESAAAIIPSPSGPALHWSKVQVLAGSESQNAQLPTEKHGSHYYAARETDSALLRVAEKGAAPEIEKFLFYRGVGSFQAPLTVKLDSADSHRVTLTNTGSEELRNLFLYQAGKSGGDWLKVEHLAPGESRAVALPEDSNKTASLTNLAAELRKALASEGLYEREAAAMVETWNSTWFSERGMRVLYTLPREWTDRTLPLQITPAPQKTERVMVGLAEVITPEMEQALLAETERYVAAKPADRPAIVDETRALGFGRFMEPTLRRVMASAKRSNEFSSLSWELLSAAMLPPKTVAAPTAAR